MRIGITERGDAGIDLSWADRLDTVDGVVLITKNLTNKFLFKVLRMKKPAVIHVTCTGYGGSALEPNVPQPEKQIDQCIELINKGFSANNIVLRIDPIFPTAKGLKKVEHVLELYQKSLYFKNVNRIRISIVDEYNHVLERYAQRGWPSIYKGTFQASAEQMKEVADFLSQYRYTFETCAEPELAQMCDNVIERGCISYEDIALMDIEDDCTAKYENPQGRRGCHCLSCKTELLTHKHPCVNGCVYCYWRN